MSRGGKRTHPHIWSNGGAPANSPQTLPALLPAPLTFGLGHASPWSTTAPQSTGACEGAGAEGEGRGDPDNYSSRRGEAMQAPKGRESSSCCPDADKQHGLSCWILTTHSIFVLPKT